MAPSEYNNSVFFFCHYTRSWFSTPFTHCVVCHVKFMSFWWTGDVVIHIVVDQIHSKCITLNTRKVNGVQVTCITILLSPITYQTKVGISGTISVLSDLGEHNLDIHAVYSWIHTDVELIGEALDSAWNLINISDIFSIDDIFMNKSSTWVGCKCTHIL